MQPPTPPRHRPLSPTALRQQSRDSRSADSAGQLRVSPQAAESTNRNKHSHNDNMETWIIITLVSLLLSALFSGCEMAYVTSDRVRVELDSKRSRPIAAILRLFYPIPNCSSPPSWWATMLFW